jgi:hypothetical protein
MGDAAAEPRAPRRRPDQGGGEDHREVDRPAAFPSWREFCSGIVEELAVIQI